jgi:hypothetical protein
MANYEEYEGYSREALIDIINALTAERSFLKEARDRTHAFVSQHLIPMPDREGIEV